MRILEERMDAARNLSSNSVNGADGFLIGLRQGFQLPEMMGQQNRVSDPTCRMPMA